MPGAGDDQIHSSQYLMSKKRHWALFWTRVLGQSELGVLAAHAGRRTPHGRLLHPSARLTREHWPSATPTSDRLSQPGEPEAWNPCLLSTWVLWFFLRLCPSAALQSLQHACPTRASPLTAHAKPFPPLQDLPPETTTSYSCAQQYEHLRAHIQFLLRPANYVGDKVRRSALLSAAANVFPPPLTTTPLRNHPCSWREMWICAC